MDSLLAGVAGSAAALFTFDLWRDYQRRPRPHIAAYGAGMTLFAIATWCLFIGVTFGWTGPVYRTFFLFGAVLNIPLLALGSMFLVVGRKSGHVMTIAIGAIAAIATTLTLTVPFQRPLPNSDIPHDMFATGFGPRVFAIIGGSAGATILIVLALVSLVRFWKKDRRIVWGSALIVAGTVAAAWGGTVLALGEAGVFALSLLLAVSFIWAGYRVASGRRQPPANSSFEGRGRQSAVT
jgi:MFS family permease